MSIDVAELVLRVKSQGVAKAEDKLDRLNKTGNTTQDVLHRVGDSSNSASKKLGTFLAAAKIGALAALASGFAKITHSADEFADSIAEVSTLVDTTTFDMDSLGNAALKAGKDFGSAQAQPRAFYSIISAGASTAAEATETLTVANRLAVGGVTELEIAADGLTSVLNAYGSEVAGATAVADTMFVGMKAGKTTIGELAANIGSVAPLAKQAGVSFDELIASTAALTKTGQTTSVSMNGVRAIISAIIKPSSEAAKQAEKLGLAFDAQALKSKGLAGFMQELKEKTKGNTEVMAQLFGGVEALTPALALTGGSAKDLADILEAMKNKAGETDAAFRKMEASPAFQKKRLFGAMEVEAIKLGKAFSEALVPAMRFLADHMADIVVVGKVVAALFAVKLGLAFAIYIKGLVRSSMETTRYNIKLATMAGLSKRAAVQQVLLGNATAAASRGFALIGGKLGVIGIAVTALTLAYQANKDEMVTLGDTTATVSEWMGASWAWIKDSIGQTIDDITGFFGSMYEEVEDPTAWDTLLGYIHEIPKNAKIVTNKTIGLFVGLFEGVVTIWKNLPAQFAIIMLLVERSVKSKIATLLKALIKPVNAIRSLANLPPINIPIKFDMPSDKAIALAKADIHSVGDAFKTALDVDYVGAFGKAFTKGVIKPVSKYIKLKPAKAFKKHALATKGLTDATRKAEQALNTATETTGKHTKAIKAASKAKEKAKTATKKLTEAQKAANKIREEAIKVLQDTIAENEKLARELAGLPPVVKGLTAAELKRYQGLLKQIEAKKKLLAQEKTYKADLAAVNKKIKETAIYLHDGERALNAYIERQKYGHRVNLDVLHDAQNRLEQLEREKELYKKLENAVGSYVDKMLHGFKGVGNTVEKLKKSLTSLLTGKGSLADVGKNVVDLVSPYKGHGKGAMVGNAMNVYDMNRQLGQDKVTAGLSAGGAAIGTYLGGPVGAMIGGFIGTMIGKIRNWLRKKAKIRMDQLVNFQGGEALYDRDRAYYETGMGRTTAFGTFGVSDATSHYGRASEDTKRAMQALLNQAEATDKLVATLMSTYQINQTRDELSRQGVHSANNAEGAQAFLENRLKIQIKHLDVWARTLFSGVEQSYEEQVAIIQKLSIATKAYVPVLKDMHIGLSEGSDSLAYLAVTLGEVSGSFENFTASYQNFVSKLFTAEEQRNLSIQAYTNRVADFNKTIVDSGFKAISSTDQLKSFILNLQNTGAIYTKTGQEAMVAALGMVNAMKALEDMEKERIAALKQLKDLGLGANEGLISVAGGLDALTKSVDNYRSLVYSSEEQALIKNAEAATQLTEIANSLGISPDSISTAEGLRAAVDALTAGQAQLTEVQQEQLVKLLDAAEAVKVLSGSGVTASEALSALPDNLKNVVGGFNDSIEPLVKINKQLTESEEILGNVALLS